MDKLWNYEVWIKNLGLFIDGGENIETFIFIHDNLTKLRCFRKNIIEIVELEWN